MFLLQADVFDWKELLLGSEEWSFLLQVLFRTVLMFIVILVGLSILGKRGVKQLSVFELVVIIGLGSAAGDPMFYKDVGLLPALIVFVLVIGLYILVTHIVGRNKVAERMIEGKPICLVEEGYFAVDKFKKENLAQDEFFAELRLKGVSQLGQIDKAIIETNGGVSVFFYSDEECRYGLPILPGSLEHKVIRTTGHRHYSCVFCGYTEKLAPADRHVCPNCGKDEWVPSSNAKRIA